LTDHPNWDRFKELSKNIIFAIFVVWIVLIPFGAYPPAWILLVSAILSYVLSDVILNFFINGGQGYAKMFTNNEFADKGHAYLVFIVGIVVGTLIINTFLDIALAQLQSTPDVETWTAIVLFVSAAVAISAAFDVEWRFYEK
jgi:hypothetical protein